MVGELLKAKDEMDRLKHILDTLELNHILDRNISDLSGGELQRFAIGIIRLGCPPPLLLAVDLFIRGVFVYPLPPRLPLTDTPFNRVQRAEG